MKPYGQPKKRRCKIHSADECGTCGNTKDAVIKNRERKKNKLKAK